LPPRRARSIDPGKRRSRQQGWARVADHGRRWSAPLARVDPGKTPVTSTRVGAVGRPRKAMVCPTCSDRSRDTPVTSTSTETKGRGGQEGCRRYTAALLLWHARAIVAGVSVGNRSVTSWVRPRCFANSGSPVFAGSIPTRASRVQPSQLARRSFSSAWCSSIFMYVW
jgi:hypothetical protein